MAIEKGDRDKPGESERIERLLKGADFLDEYRPDPDTLRSELIEVEDPSDRRAVMENADRLINKHSFLKDLWKERVATLPADLETNMCHMLPIIIEHAERAAAEPAKVVKIGHELGKFLKPYLPPTDPPSRVVVNRILNDVWELTVQSLIQLRQPKIVTQSEVDQLLKDFFDKDH